MHTLHYIAVEAESKEEAFQKVVDELEPTDYGRVVEWSDWHVVGGGRWNSDHSNQYNDSSNDIISYKEDKQKFLEAIDGVRKARIQEMNRNLDKINVDKFISDVVDYISNGGELDDDDRYDMNSYYISSAAKMMRNYWTPDSYFFDLTYGSAGIQNLLARLDNEEASGLQYLVPVDFHF